MSEDSQKSKGWLTEEQYSQYREALQRSEDASSDEFDKVMISLSGGALAISIAFINQIAPSPKCFSLCILAWSAFVVAMTCTLVSFRTTQEAMRSQAEALEKIRYEGGDFETSVWDRRTAILNNSSLVSFVAGVILLIVFVAKQ